ncbi:cytochrome P450 [Neurospora crassa]|nr:cytochrome P450 [Neurospora crassa]
MGLVEDVAGNLSLKNTPIIFGGVLLGLIVFRYLQVVWQNLRIARMGLRPPKIRDSGLFGIRFIRTNFKMAAEHKNLQFWQQMFRSIGGYTGEVRLVGHRIIFTSEPENIKAILATQFEDYGKGEGFHQEWKAFLGDSIFTTDGDLWHASRQLIRPLFIKNRVSDLQCFENHMQMLFRTIANGGALNGEDQMVDMEAGDGKPVDISDLFFRYTLDAATDFLLGKDIKSLSTPVQPFADAFQEVQRVQIVIARAGPLNRFVPRKTFWEGLKVIDETINFYIDRALRLDEEELASKSKGDEGYTFLHALAGFTKNRQVLHDQLMAVLLAGRDTTACTLSWAIYELARNPEAVAKLRAEILSVVGPDRAPTYDDLKSMKYLQNVMNETLRLYPVVPFNVRMALKDTTLPRGGGPDGSQPIVILKDTPVGYSPLAMQRRPDLYPPVSEKFPDVEMFSPDRWFHWQPKPWQYIPFNGGPRICIGQQFALTEMGYVLTRLFQRYDRVVSYMDEIDGGKPRMKTDIVLMPGDGVKVAFFEAKRE